MPVVENRHGYKPTPVLRFSGGPTYTINPSFITTSRSQPRARWQAEWDGEPDRMSGRTRVLTAGGALIYRLNPSWATMVQGLVRSGSGVMRVDFAALQGTIGVLLDPEASVVGRQLWLSTIGFPHDALVDSHQSWLWLCGGFVGQQAEDTQAPKLGEAWLPSLGPRCAPARRTTRRGRVLRSGRVRTIIPAHAFVVDDFYIDRFPFPGVDGANWFTDGAHHSTIEALDAKLADFGRRACTIPELLYAAAGPDNLRYPYGDAYVSGQCDGDDATWAISTFTASDFGVRDFMVRATGSNGRPDP